MALWKYVFLFFALKLNLVRVAGKPGPSHEQQLVDYLLTGYNKHARPVANSSKAVLVETEFHLLQLSELSERDQILTTFAWLKMSWTDDYLVWNTTNYDGLSSVVVPASEVWLPDVTFQNSAEEMYDEIYDEKFRVELFNTGKVVWFPGGKMVTQCELDVTFFPFDDQKCSLDLVNWAYNSYQVNLTNTVDTVDLTEYAVSGEWEIPKTEVSTSYSFHSDEPGVPFPKVHFTLFLRRKTTYHMINVVFPCIIMSLLSLLIFYLPADSGEKVSLGITVLLSFAVYLVLIEENMPKTSDYMPAITIYVTIIMALCALSLLFTIFVLNFHHQMPNKVMPLWQRKMIFGLMAKVVCMKPSNPSKVAEKQAAPNEKVNGDVISIQSEFNTEKKHKTELSETNSFSEILEHLRLITEHQQSQARDSASLDEWRYAAKILDSFFFLVATVLTCFFSIVLMGFYPLAQPGLT